MPKQVYSVARASAAYAVFSGVSFDIKQGLAENGISIAYTEDFGERHVGTDSTLWSEYATKHGTMTLEYLANSPAVPFFQNLHTTQRMTGTTGLDTVTVLDRDMQTTFTGSDVAIQSITGHGVKKAKGDSVVVTLNCGNLDIVGV